MGRQICMVLYCEFRVVLNHICRERERESVNNAGDPPQVPVRAVARPVTHPGSALHSLLRLCSCAQARVPPQQLYPVQMAVSDWSKLSTQLLIGQKTRDRESSGREVKLT